MSTCCRQIRHFSFKGRLSIKRTDEADVGHEAAVVVVVRTAGDGVRRHLAVHVEVGESRPEVNKQ